MSDREQNALEVADRAKSASLAERLKASYETATVVSFGGVDVKVHKPKVKAVARFQAWVREGTEPFKEALKDPQKFLDTLPESDQADMERKMEWFHVETTLKTLKLVSPEMFEVDPETGKRIVTDEEIMFTVEDEGGDRCPLLVKARHMCRVGRKLIDPFGLPESTE